MSGRFSGQSFSFPLGEKTYIMGIVNITPDSFSDGGRYFAGEDALRHACELERQGADLVDVGAMSTRPNSERISVQEEIERLSCLGEICRHLSVPVSVDTFNPETAQFALRQGAAIINDVSGCFQPDMAAVVREAGCGYVVMHWRSERAEKEVEYPGGVIRDVRAYFDDMMETLTNAGLTPEQICLDPGFGFAKNTRQNLELLRALSQLQTQGVCLLSALSRKRFVGEVSGVAEADRRDVGTAAGCVISVQQGADMVRVHNVPVCKEALLMADAVYRSHG